MDRTVQVEFWSEIVGEPEPGLWCDGCLLPSAVRARVVAGTGMTVWIDSIYVACNDCGLVFKESPA